MKKRILDFLRAERLYLVFFVLLFGVFVFMNLKFPGWRQSLSSAAAYETFLKEEKAFQGRLDTPEEVMAVFSSRPVLAGAAYTFTALFFLLFCTGVAVDLFLVFSKKFRRGVFQKHPGIPETWGLGAVLHVVVQGMVFSLLLNLVLGALWHFLPFVDERAAPLFHTLLMDGGIMALIVRELHRRGVSWKSLGFDFQGRKASREVWFGACGYAAVIPVFVGILVALMTLAQWLSYEPEPHPLMGIFLNEDRRAQWMIVLSLFLACLWGPFFEEVFFRGFCYPAFRKIAGPMGGGILTASFFALIHQNEFAFLPILLLGTGLAFLYELRANLTAPLALHIVHNTVFITYFFIAKGVMAATVR